MAIARDKLRWNGWGWADRTYELGGAADLFWEWIGRTLGQKTLDPWPGPDLDDVEMPASSLKPKQVDRLAALLDPLRVKTDAFERAFHARGQSYHDLLVRRTGTLPAAPDAVVYPRDAAEIEAILDLAAQESWAVVPFGGGSSVVGGVNTPAETGHKAVICLDTSLLDKLISVDSESMTATAQAGIYGPALEEALQNQGFTLGHYPQSFEFSTLGGWIAARGAGQQSNRYGKAEEWLVSARLVTPGGLWSTEGFPASACGPQLTDLVLGSEGTLGIITEATVRLHRTPEERDYRGYLFKDFESGLAAARRLVQEEVPMATLRLSDADETFFQGHFASLGKTKSAIEQAFKLVLEWRGYYRTPCLMLAGVEGDRELVRPAVTASRHVCRDAGAMPLGDRPGRKWFAGRFDMPYLRDPLMDRGIGVDTLETAASWSKIFRLYCAVKVAIDGAMRDLKVKAVVMTHLSHVYADGASLYFTFVFPIDRDDPVGQWWTIKQAASEAIAANGGTISHHHGVGTDHARWLPDEKGPIGTALLRAIKADLDPAGLLNPGKLLPAEEDEAEES